MHKKIIALLINQPRINYINYLIILYALTLSFPSEIKRVIAILMILLWVTDRTKYDFKLPKTNIFLFFGIFIGYCLLSYLWSDASFKEAIMHIRKYWYYLPVFIIFKYLKKEYFEFTISSFFIGMFITEILSYGNFFGIWQVGLGKTQDPTVFMQHTLYSIFLSITAVFLLIKILNTKNNKSKIFYSIFFITVTLNLLLNAGRTGYFTLFITLFITIIFIYKVNYKIIITTIFVSFLTLFLAYNFSKNFNLRTKAIYTDVKKVIENQNFNTSVGARIGFWVVASEIIKENPIIGVGIANNIKEKNNFVIANKQAKRYQYIKKLLHFHNYYLEVVTQFGLIGLSLFFYLIYLIFSIKINDIEIKTLKVSAISIFLIGSFSDMLFYLNDTMFIIAFIIGLILSKSKFEYQESINSKY